MIYILAGTLAEAERYRREQRLPATTTRIIVRVSDVRGLGPSSDVRYVGQWRMQDPELLHLLWWSTTQGAVSYDEWITAETKEPISSITQVDFVLVTAGIKDLSCLSEDLLTCLADIHSGCLVSESRLRALLTALYGCPNKAAESFVPDLLL